MATKGWHIDFMFLAPPTLPLDLMPVFQAVLRIPLSSSLLNGGGGLPGGVTDSSTPNFSGHRGLLVVYVFVLHLLSNFPEWSPLLGTTGAPAPSSSQDPVSLRSRSRNDSNTVSVLVSLMHLLQVHYRFFIRGTRVTRITRCSRPPGGVGLTPRQYTAWNV